MAEGPGRILLVDDEPALLKMLEAYLVRLGHSVTATDTSAKARMEVERAPGEFAVAVLDASLPGEGLHSLAMSMLMASPALHVLAASGYPVDMTALEAVAPGRVAFLHKPFSPQMLADIVRRMLGAQEEDL